MTAETEASTATSTPAARTGQDTGVLDPEVRLGLYETMVLCRTYEEAILRRVPRGQGARLRHRQGPHPRRDAPVRRAGTGRRRRLRAPHRRRRRDGDAPAAPLRDRPRRGPATDDRGDLRPGDRAGPRTRRPHAPVRPRHPLLLLGHHRGGLPAGARRRRSRSSGAAPTASPSPSPARAPPTRARSTSRSTWRRCGSCRSCSSSRTTTGAISVPRAASTAVPSNAARAAAYGMPGERVEDNDVEAVYAAAAASRGHGPAPAAAPRSSRCTRCGCGGTSRATPRATGPSSADVPERDPIPRYEQRPARGRRARRRTGSPGSATRRASASRTAHRTSPRAARCPTRRDGHVATCSR